VSRGERDKKEIFTRIYLEKEIIIGEKVALKGKEIFVSIYIIMFIN